MIAILGLPFPKLCISDFKQVEETCHHEYLADLVIDILNDNLSALDRSFLTDGQEQTKTRTTDVLKVRTVENDFLVCILKQWSNLLLSLYCCRCVKSAVQNVY